MPAAERRVSVRLDVVGGKEVKAELEGIGSSGEKSFGRLSREMKVANQRVGEFYRRVKIAAAVAAAAVAAGAVAMIRSSLDIVDAQAKLAQSLDTTVASIQVLTRAGELAGVSFGGIEQATKDLTRRLSQAAASTGPAVKALERLKFSAAELLALPLDERVRKINQAILDFVPAAERAAVAGQLFGEEGSIAISRIDTATLRQATRDLRDFGVVVSEQDADQIERTNDAISRLGLVWRGLSNQITVRAAPALQAVADALAAVSKVTGPLGQALKLLFDNIGRLAAIAAAFAAFIAGRFVAGLLLATFTVKGLATALVFLRGALIRTGIGALIVGAGELIYQFGRLVQSTGSFGAAMKLLGDVAREVWGRMGLYVDLFKARIALAWLGIQAVVADALQASVAALVAFANGAVNTFEGSFKAIVVIWGLLPAAIGNLAIQAANALIAGVEAMLNASVRGMNRLFEALNKGFEACGFDRRVTLIPEINFGRIKNEFAGRAKRAGNAVNDAFASAFEESPFEVADLGFAEFAAAARRAADGVRLTVDELARLAGAPLQSWAALRDAMRGTTEEANKTADAIVKAGAADEGTAKKTKDAADKTKAGWDAVNDSLGKYAVDAMNWSQAVGGTLVNSFKGAEDAFVNFVKTGKLDFKSLADSMISDLIRIAVRSAILGPLANALGGIFGAFVGGHGFSAGRYAGAAPGTAPIIPVYSVPLPVLLPHGGGVIGRDAFPARMVDPAVFDGASRYHRGGIVAGEVPIVARHGEGMFTPGQMRSLAPVSAAKPVVNVAVNVRNTAPGTQASANVRRELGGNLTLDIMIEQIEGGMARNIGRGQGMAPTLEYRYGLNPAAGSLR